jgi:DNA-binding beta-propeller fold protein YncE
MTAKLGLIALLLVLAAPAGAELGLPPGFTTEVYVTGQGFETSGERGVNGIPAVGTLGMDAAGTLYLSRTGARFRSGDVEDLWALYRIPVGGGRLSPETEGRYLYGPPLPNPQIGAVTAGGAVWVTTYDRERRLGALYRFLDGKPSLFAGGRPSASATPLFRQPEGVAISPAGDVYVTDREEGAIVRLDARGNLVSPRHATVLRPRMLTMDEAGNIWVGGDGTAETPFGSGNGEITRVTAEGRTQSVLQGPLPAGFSFSPGGALFVVQRRTGQLFALTPDGRRLDFATARDGTYVRTLGFAPVTPETRKAGIAGDLFLVLVSRSMWLINEVIRVSGPFDEWVRQESSRATP